MGFKDLSSIALCGDTTRINDVQRCTSVHRDVLPITDFSDPKVVDFPYIGGMVTAPMFSPDEDFSRITLHAESGLLVERKPSHSWCDQKRFDRLLDKRAF